MKTVFAKTVEYVTLLRDRSKDRLDDFKNKFADNAYNALRWGDDVFLYACEYQLAVELIEGPLALTDKTEEDIVKLIIETLRGDVMRGARYGSFRSTSMAANKTEESMLQARARMLEKITEYQQSFDWQKQFEAEILEEEKQGKLRWREAAKNEWRANVKGVGEYKVQRSAPGSRRWAVLIDGAPQADYFTSPDEAKAAVGLAVRAKRTLEAA